MDQNRIMTVTTCPTWPEVVTRRQHRSPGYPRQHRAGPDDDPAVPDADTAGANDHRAPHGRNPAGGSPGRPDPGGRRRLRV